ncbi:response regulator receiver modulated diguanylate cyclase with PAS/PAC sensor [Desulfovibrio sp. X2]|uniref:diguanylate cyclase domain-containing protein n=1 Tax=Desulfovibrio sp. X2 TaxID=941449 RepID=UPI000358E324|nr:diguanylate cyclase [Desulfovibrio sp. X2]EPR39361.1 response regulator receiver modulated diguanylate cyclase with PAS/PAC sensor [Desulfovibrio sp. X2]
MITQSKRKTERHGSPVGKQTPAVLLVAGDEGTHKRIAGLLAAEGGGHVLHSAGGLDEGLRLLGAGKADVILFDAPSMNAMAKALSRLRDLFPQVPSIVLSDSQDMALCDRALTDGAQDFLVKERLTSFGLALSIRFAIDRQRVLAAQDRRIKVLAADLSNFRSLVEQGPDGLLVVGEDGTVHYANEVALRLLGRTEADTLGQAFGYPVIKGGAVELDLRRTDHESATVEMTAEEIFWEGDPAYIVSLRDATARTEHTAEQLRRIEMERLVSSVSTLFVGIEPERVGHGIQDSLRMLGEAVHADRAFIFLLSADGHFVRQAYEWSAMGVEPTIGRDPEMTTDSLSWLMERLEIFETALVTDVSSLPKEAMAERAMLAQRRARTMVAVAMNREGERLGFVGFEAVRQDRMWSEEDIGLLKVASEIWAAALQRRRGDIEGLALKELLEILVGSDGDGIFVEDRGGRVVQANERLGDFVPSLPAHPGLPGMAVADILARLAKVAQDPKATRTALEDMARSHEIVSGERVALSSGSTLETECHPLRVRGEVAGRLWRIRDVTAREADQHARTAHVRRDALTGLSMRQRFVEDVGVLLAGVETRATKAALLLADLDAFRAVNATYGLDVGDEVLRQAAKRLAECVGSGDSIGRTGSAEFGLFLAAVGDQEEVEQVARRARRNLEAPYQVGERAVVLSASLGGAVWGEHVHSVEELFTVAGEALVQAKAQGGGQMVLSGQSSCRV